jgi:hypothetical protein
MKGWKEIEYEVVRDSRVGTPSISNIFCDD